MLIYPHLSFFCSFFSPNQMISNLLPEAHGQNLLLKGFYGPSILLEGEFEYMFLPYLECVN